MWLRALSGFAIGLVLGIAGVAAADAVWTHGFYRLEAIRDGRFYKSAAMPPEILVSTCRQLGIRTVIDLRTLGSTDCEQPESASEVAKERMALHAANLRHVHVPADQVPDRATVAAFLDEIRTAGNGPFLVHCHHGTGRAVLFSAIYRIEQEGWTPEDALRHTRLILSGSSFDPDIPRGGKGRFLLAYRPGPRIASQ